MTIVRPGVVVPAWTSTTVAALMTRSAGRTARPGTRRRDKSGGDDRRLARAHGVTLARMALLTRRALVVTCAAAPWALVSTARRGATQAPLRMLLNSGYSSVNAWFCLAEDRGYLKAAGLQLTFSRRPRRRTPRPGAPPTRASISATATSMRSSSCVATAPDRAPARRLHDVQPLALGGGGAGWRRRCATLADLAGPAPPRGHATDVALQTFPALRRAHRRRRAAACASRPAKCEHARAGRWHAQRRERRIFGYESTIAAALVGAGQPVDAACASFTTGRSSPSSTAAR